MNRITSNTIARNILADINAVNTKLAKTQQQLASGKLLTRPSDDPAAVGRALQYRKDVEETQQYQRNASEAQGWADVTDSALTTINDVLQRVRELTVRGANGTAGPEAHAAIVAELRGLIDSVKIAGNANYGGRYVFAGTKTDVEPYEVGGPDDYAGDELKIMRQIGPGVEVPVSMYGREVIGDEDEGLLATMRTVLDHMENGMHDALGTDLDLLDDHVDVINAVRATIGATSNRIEIATARLAEYEGTALQLLTDTESVDFAKAMIDFTTQQNAMQAGLKAGASIVQNSLLDFLR